MSVRAQGDYATEKGNLIAVSSDGDIRRVGVPGVQVNHVGTTPDGRLFSVDDWRNASRLVIGSTVTGKTTDICEARTSMGPSQATHGHPYLSPDARWLVFNSDNPGRPQIHAAEIPPTMIEEVLEGLGPPEGARRR